MTFKAACVQINTGNDMVANVARATELIRQAADQGATFITLPENVAFMAENREELFANAYTTQEHPALDAFQDIARRLSVKILVGSLAVMEKDSEKLRNRCFLVDATGALIAHYDKIHMYDASVAGGESHRESHSYDAGAEATLVHTNLGMLGMTICYDLRFPYLYRHLAKQGAKFITVPSAFTRFTGEAHWHVLLRARAIETGSYIIAPAQVGSHPRQRETYGHSLIVDPWGTVLADAGGDEEGVVLAEIDLERVNKVRQSLPSLEHDREINA